MSNKIFKEIHPDDRSYQSIETNKEWNILSSNASSSFGILTYKGQSGSIHDSKFRDGGTSNGVFKRLLWNSINHLCYDKFRIDPYAASDNNRQRLNDIGGAPPLFERTTRIRNIAKPLPGESEPPRQVDPNSTGQNNQYSPAPGAYIPSQLHTDVAILSIPRNIFGTEIQRGTFELVSDGKHIVTDDGKGALVSSSHNNVVQVGDIFYERGLAVITSNSHSNQDLLDDYELKFRATHDVHNFEYTCRATEREYNMSLNPSLLTRDSFIRTVVAAGFPGGERIDLNFNRSIRYQPNTLQSGASSSIDQTIHGGGGATLAVEHIAASASNFLKVISRGTSNKFAFIKYKEETGVLYNLKFNYVQGTVNGRVFKTSEGVNGDQWSEIYTESQNDIEIAWSGSTNNPTMIKFAAEGVADKHAYYDKISLTSDRQQSSGLTKVRGMATHSQFQPFITTVGLYNNFNELLAVGKLPKPIRKPDNYDISFQIKIDK